MQKQKQLSLFSTEAIKTSIHTHLSSNKIISVEKMFFNYGFASLAYQRGTQNKKIINYLYMCAFTERSDSNKTGIERNYVRAHT